MKLSDPAKLTKLKHLATVPSTDEPIISLYVPVSATGAIEWTPIDQRLALLKATLTPWYREPFDEAVTAAKKVAGSLARSACRDLAIFTRGGKAPFVDSLIVTGGEGSLKVMMDTVPCLWPLLSHGPSTEQYILVHLDHYAARIEEWRISPHFDAWFFERPLDPSTVASRFGRECYQIHRREQSEASLKEKIEILHGVLAPHGRRKIIITGKAPMVRRLFKALPPNLAEFASTHLVATEDAALSAIIHAEKVRFSKENQTWPHLTQWRRAVWRDGLATAGFEETSDAVRRLPMETILIAKEHSASAASRDLMKNAMRHGVGLKVIDDSHTLLALGGAGGLLKRRPQVPMRPREARIASMPTALSLPLGQL